MTIEMFQGVQNSYELKQVLQLHTLELLRNKNIKTSCAQIITYENKYIIINIQ